MRQTHLSSHARHFGFVQWPGHSSGQQTGTSRRPSRANWGEGCCSVVGCWSRHNRQCPRAPMVAAFLIILSLLDHSALCFLKVVQGGSDTYTLASLDVFGSQQVTDGAFSNRACLPAAAGAAVGTRRLPGESGASSRKDIRSSCHAVCKSWSLRFSSVCASDTRNRVPATCFLPQQCAPISLVANGRMPGTPWQVWQTLYLACYVETNLAPFATGIGGAKHTALTVINSFMSLLRQSRCECPRRAT